MSHWQKKPLGEIAESVDYGVTASATEQLVGPKFLRITDIQGGTVNWDSVPWCECDASSAAQARLKPGDIVFARTGATTGKSFLIRECPSDAVFASYLIRVRFRNSVEPRFVSHFFQTLSYWAQIAKIARGVAQPGVNATTLKALEIPLPPLAEQRHIADVLDQAETLRARRRAALAQLDSLTQSLFLDIFSRTTTLFQSVKLSQVCEEEAPITYGILQPGPHIEDGIPYVRPSEIKDGKINLSAIRRTTPAIANKYKKSTLRAGDILITIVGTIGSVAIIPGELEGGNITQSSARVRVSPSKADRRFVEHFLRSHLAKRQYDQHRLGVAVERLNLHHVRDLDLPLPAIELQREFARRVAVVEAVKTAQRASLAELDALFASLQHRAFRGEL